MKVIKKILLGLLILILIFLMIGIVSPEVSYTTEIMVNRPVEKTFDMFTDSSKMKFWIPNFKSVELVEGEPGKKGAVYRMVVHENGQDYILTERVTSYKENQEYAFVVENEVLTNHVSIIFTAEKDQTKIKATSKIKGKGFMMKSSLALMKSYFKNQDRDAYGKFKELLEEE